MPSTSYKHSKLMRTAKKPIRHNHSARMPTSTQLQPLCTDATYPIRHKHSALMLSDATKKKQACIKKKQGKKTFFSIYLNLLVFKLRKQFYLAMNVCKY